MEYITQGREFYPNKKAQIYYNPTENFSNVEIANQCFLLSFITEGACLVSINNKRVLLTAPCFICLNEKDIITVIENKDMKAQSLYFKPTFYSSTLTFEALRMNNSKDLSERHNCYLFMPFVKRDDGYQGILPVNLSLNNRVNSLISSAGEELVVQRDWYWSCRCRSYFTELLIILERIYNENTNTEAQSPTNFIILPLEYKDIEKVLLYLHTNYHNNIRVDDIVREFNTNRTTLSNRFKKGTGYTIIEYLNKYRTQLAEALLLYTNLKVEEICLRLGFGDTAYFSRVFSKHYGLAPQKYREVQNSKE